MAAAVRQAVSRDRYPRFTGLFARIVTIPETRVEPRRDRAETLTMSELVLAATVGDRLDRAHEIHVSLDAYWLGKCAEAFGDPELALAYFRRALETASSPREATRRRATLGAALRRTRALDEALEVLLGSVELDPSFDTNRESYTALLELRRCRGELRKALDLGRAMAPTLRDDPWFARAYDSLLVAIDRITESAGSALPVPHLDPFSAAQARAATCRREAEVLEQHLLAFGESVGL
jgi:tetratricopeptide (TPR) repeat protein